MSDKLTVSTGQALSLSKKELKKEARLERTWEKLLTQDNKSESFQSDSISKISSNWAVVVKNMPTIQSSCFVDLPELLDALIEQCRTKKWYKALSDAEKGSFQNDCEVYIAGEIWDFKRIAGHCIDERCHNLAGDRHVSRKLRTATNEGVRSGMKRLDEPVKKLNQSSDNLLAQTEAISKKLEVPNVDINDVYQVLLSIIPEAQAVAQEVKEAANALKEAKNELVLAVGKKWDERYQLINPPSGIKVLRSGNLYQFPEAK